MDIGLLSILIEICEKFKVDWFDFKETKVKKFLLEYVDEILKQSLRSNPEVPEPAGSIKLAIYKLTELLANIAFNKEKTVLFLWLKKKHLKFKIKKKKKKKIFLKKP